MTRHSGRAFDKLGKRAGDLGLQRKKFSHHLNVGWPCRECPVPQFSLEGMISEFSTSSDIVGVLSLNSHARLPEACGRCGA